MLVYIVPRSPYRVVLEDAGAYLEVQLQADEQVGARFFSPGDKPDLRGALPSIDARGCLGVLQLKSAIFLLVAIPPVSSVGDLGDDVEQLHDVLFLNLAGQHLPFARTPAHPCFHLRNVLAPGTFYYSESFDLTTRYENRVKAQLHREAACTPAARDSTSIPFPPPFLAGTPEFTWNHYTLAPLLRLRDSLDPHEQAVWDSRFFALPVVQGFYGVKEIPLVGGDKAVLTVLSRRGWARAGTRFKKRGIDDEGAGAVGNFAETETILQVGEKIIAHVQIRGSVPLKWQEHPHWRGPINLHIDKPLIAASLQPFLLHIRSLLRSYSQVHVLSLLSHDETGPLALEGHLGDAYAELCSTASQQDPLIATNLRYQQHEIHREEMLPHEASRIPLEIVASVQSVIDDFGATVVSVDPASGKTTLEEEQKGVFRVNCRDCLDRTSLGEFTISQAVLAARVEKLGMPPFEGSLLEKAHRRLFADNCDALSHIYAGSPAMNSDFIRTGVFGTKQLIENGVNSELRREQGMLHDQEKNKATELLTGQHRKQPPPPVLICLDRPPLPASSRIGTSFPLADTFNTTPFTLSSAPLVKSSVRVFRDFASPSTSSLPRPLP
ncbi:hypothetical protein JCM8097_006101 [Rhodosporidiobolus ruineniae]